MLYCSMDTCKVSLHYEPLDVYSNSKTGRTSYHILCTDVDDASRGREGCGYEDGHVFQKSGYIGDRGTFYHPDQHSACI